MSPLLARVMLTIFMLPCAAIVYVIAFACADQLVNHSYSTSGVYFDLDWLWGGAAASLFVGAYWILLWRRTVAWTSQRVTRTAIAALLALTAGLAAAIGFGGMIHVNFGLFVGTTVAPLSWLVMTTFVWRESTAERAERAAGVGAIACPSCGYNLTGLKGTRCPECGTEFTLDQLLPSRRDLRVPDLS